jgi:hypothetical protein
MRVIRPEVNYHWLSALYPWHRILRKTAVEIFISRLKIKGEDKMKMEGINNV